MASVTHEGDSRFADAEADVERGEPWAFRDADAPNPLTLLAGSWSTGHTKFGEAEFLSGTDRDGKRWSVLVASVVLRKRLIEGVLETWDDEKQAFVVTETLGRVEPGEVVSLKYLGDGENAQGQTYPRFSVSRKPVTASEEATADDDIPF
jgi:hypothetical protein